MIRAESANLWAVVFGGAIIVVLACWVWADAGKSKRSMRHPVFQRSFTDDELDEFMVPLNEEHES